MPSFDSSKSGSNESLLIIHLMAYLFSMCGPMKIKNDNKKIQWQDRHIFVTESFRYSSSKASHWFQESLKSSLTKSFGSQSLGIILFGFWLHFLGSWLHPVMYFPFFTKGRTHLWMPEEFQRKTAIFHFLFSIFFNASCRCSCWCIILKKLM